MKSASAGILALALLATRSAAPAQTEFHLQYGIHKNPFTAAEDQTFVFTVHQASRWELGDSFFFLDYLAGGGAKVLKYLPGLRVSWALPIEIGHQALALAGHAGYVGGSTDELGQDLKGSILAQPQFTWDLGKAIAGAPHQLMAGIEYQYWRNKLGTDEDESAEQLLLVWRL